MPQADAPGTVLPTVLAGLYLEAQRQGLARQQAHLHQTLYYAVELITA